MLRLVAVSSCGRLRSNFFSYERVTEFWISARISVDKLPAWPFQYKGAAAHFQQQDLILSDFRSMPVPETTLAKQVAIYALQLGHGNLVALGKLYDLTAERLLRYARTLTRNTSDAEDALQAAMCRVSQYPEQLARSEYPWAYFLKIVRNETLKVIQRRVTLTCQSGSTEVWSIDDQGLEREESAACVRAALQRLPAEQAEVVVLKIWEAMTFAEIAVVLGESQNTVASRYRYAIEKLTRLLEPLAREECHHV